MRSEDISSRHCAPERARGGVISLQKRGWRGEPQDLEGEDKLLLQEEYELVEDVLDHVHRVVPGVIGKEGLVKEIEELGLTILREACKDDLPADSGRGRSRHCRQCRGCWPRSRQGTPLP